MASAKGRPHQVVTRIYAAPTAFASLAPYPVGIVDLHSGLRIACRLVEPEHGDFQIGCAMEMVVLQHDDGPLFAARVRPEAGFQESGPS